MVPDELEGAHVVLFVEGGAEEVADAGLDALDDGVFVGEAGGLGGSFGAFEFAAVAVDLGGAEVAFSVCGRGRGLVAVPIMEESV